jgi:hypothetical protein
MTKSKVEFSISTIMSNEVTKKQLHGYVQELAICRDKMKSEANAIKDIKSVAKNDLGIPGKILNQLLKEYLDDGSIEAEILQLEEAKQLSDGVFDK